jgi:hypothetical protein
MYQGVFLFNLRKHLNELIETNKKDGLGRLFCFKKPSSIYPVLS